MRGFIIGLVLIPVMAITVLSMRPGGLRAQFRHAARRLKLVLILFGIYFTASAALRLAFPGRQWTEWALAALGAVLAVAFLVLGQDPTPSPPPATGQPNRQRR